MKDSVAVSISPRPRLSGVCGKGVVSLIPLIRNRTPAGTSKVKSGPLNLTLNW